MQKPVLLKEVLEILKPGAGQNYLDATIGDGGHTKAILEKIGPTGKVLGIDWDEKQIERLNKIFQPEIQAQRLILVNDNFKNVENIIRKYNFGPVSGVFFDLGFSLYHIEESGRGFSFRKNEPILMNYGGSVGGLTAGEILNSWPEEKIAEILKEYGQEKFYKQIAKKICQKREKNPVKTTFDLVAVINEAVPFWYQKRRIHPATKTFQALRIAVNDEFGNIMAGLDGAYNVLGPEGRLAVIAFHSGEDRIVKNFFKNKAREGRMRILTKKIIKASEAELLTNPNSRSAKLRAGEKIRV